jgi:hypothetical protein
VAFKYLFYYNHNALQGTFLLQIRKTSLLLVQFRGELAALTRRSNKLSSKSFLRHVAEIVVKMKKCTFLESKFLLASCKFVDNFADGDASRSRESLTCPNLSASISSYTTLV